MLKHSVYLLQENANLCIPFIWLYRLECCFFLSRCRILLCKFHDLILYKCSNSLWSLDKVAQLAATRARPLCLHVIAPVLLRSRGQNY
ncbi:hypothetical protein FKM82_000121 [Ascaphus truei]